LIGLVADKKANDFKILISCRFSRPVASPTGFFGRALCERERRERSSYGAARVIHLLLPLPLGKLQKYRRRHRLRPRRPFVSAANGDLSQIAIAIALAITRSLSNDTQWKSETGNASGFPSALRYVVAVGKMRKHRNNDITRARARFVDIEPILFYRPPTASRCANKRKIESDIGARRRPIK